MGKYRKDVDYSYKAGCSNTQAGYMKIVDDLREQLQKCMEREAIAEKRVSQLEAIKVETETVIDDRNGFKKAADRAARKIDAKFSGKGLK